MNENEMKMIEEMAEKISDCSMGNCVFCNGRHKCIYYKSAETLYNANCRIIGEDEIVVKKSEYEELKTNIEDLQTKLGAVMLCIKNTHEIDISDLLEKQKRATAREILQELKDRQTFMLADEVFGRETVVTRKINELAEKYGIELED